MKKFKILISFGVIAALAAGLVLQPLHQAYASTLLNISNTMSTLKVGTLSNHAIIFRTPIGVDASTDTITITFPTGFAMGTFALLNFDLAASDGGQTSCPTGLTYTERTLATAAAAGTWGVGQSGQVVTFTAPTDATAGNVPTHACVRIRIGNNATFSGAGVNQITNPGTAGPYTISIAGTFGDTGSVTVQILTDDQVAVTATVPQSITFALGANSLGLGTLLVTASATSSHTVTVATNAAHGFVATYAGATLTSGAFTITAMSSTAASAIGTEQFGLNAVANTTPAVGLACSGIAPIASAAVNYSTANSFRFVSGETILSSAGAVNTSTCTISYIANIAGTTEAGAYSTALTYTATAQF